MEVVVELLIPWLWVVIAVLSAWARSRLSWSGGSGQGTTSVQGPSGATYLPRERFLIPVPYVVFGSLTVACLLAAFGWRLKRDLEEASSGEGASPTRSP